MLSVTVIKKILLARYLHQLAVRELKSTGEMMAFAGVNLLHDGLEAFLLGVAEHVNAKIAANTRFDQYLDLIDANISPKQPLPFRSKLLRLNRIRVDSKHHAIRPDPGDVAELLPALRDFFEQVTDAVLHLNFATISLVDLLEDGKTKEALKNAERELENGSYADCLLNCRKAIYLEIEKDYDIAPFGKDKGPLTTYYLRASSRAPVYARTEAYIEQNVKDPIDYIVLGRNELNAHLNEIGVDLTVFWNVWRLTPAVYFMKDLDRWAVKKTFERVKDKKGDAEYVFAAVVDIVLGIHLKRRQMKYSEFGGYRLVQLRREEVPVYVKAQKSGSVQMITPKGVSEVISSWSVDGLDSGVYWYCVDAQARVVGYIADDDIATVKDIPEADMVERLLRHLTPSTEKSP